MSGRTAFSSNNFVSLHESIKSFNLESVKAGYTFDPESINTIDQTNGWSPLYKAIVYEQEKIAQFLLQHGANPNVKNNIGESPLHYVCENSNYKLAQVLLSHRADPNFTQTDGNTALHIACKKNDFNMIRVLLSYNCDLNLRNNSGRTPLHLVAENRNLELFKYLFECGADPTIADKWKRKPHQITRDRAFYEVVKKAVKSDENESFYSISGANPLDESRSSRVSICSRDGSFIKDPPLDVQRLIKNVNVSVSDLASNQIKSKPEQFENVSQSFQKQLKSITNILNINEDVRNTEDPISKKVRKLRVNKSVAALERLPINKKSDENAENQNPNITQNKLTQIKDRNYRQSNETSKQIHKHTLTNAIVKNVKSPPLVEKQTINANIPKSEENQYNQKPLQMLRNSKQVQSVQEFDFRSPLSNMIGDVQSTQASSGQNNPTSNDRFVTTKELKTVQPFTEATKNSPTKKMIGTEAAGLFSSQVYNINQSYTAMFDGNLSMSMDISREIREEKDVLELLKALHTPKNPYVQAFVHDSNKVSPILEQNESPVVNFDSQIKQIFSKTLPENKISDFQAGLEIQDKKSECSKSIQLQTSIGFTQLSMRQWLSEIGLEQFTPNFNDNGYKNFHEFAQDFSNRAPVDLIYKFGIDKAGHRATIMLKLKEDIGELHRPPVLKCVKEYPDIENWLKAINLHQYYQNFVDAGYETLENIIMQVGFKDIPFNDNFLREELCINNEKHRAEILKHLNHLYKTTVNVATPRRPREGLYCGANGVGIIQYFKKYMPF